MACQHTEQANVRLPPQLFLKVLTEHPSSVLNQIGGIWFPDRVQPHFQSPLSPV